jgi:hypothetical protein
VPFARASRRTFGRPFRAQTAQTPLLVWAYAL